MPPRKLSFKTEKDYLRYLQHQEDSRNYRARCVLYKHQLVFCCRSISSPRHREKCRAAGRERMARLRANANQEQQARNREAQARYREK
jgi:hypothetical protein